MPIEHVHLSDIRRDEGLQARVRTRMDVVEDYADHLADGETLPPPKVCRDDTGAIWPWDGNHTIEAHIVNATTQGTLDSYMLDVDVQPGSREDALLLAAGANAAHGLRRSQADRRRAVLIVLGHATAATWSDRAIARHCHVSHPLVAAVRAERDAALAGLSDEDSEADEEVEVEADPVEIFPRRGEASPAQTAPWEAGPWVAPTWAESPSDPDEEPADETLDEPDETDASEGGDGSGEPPPPEPIRGPSVWQRIRTRQPIGDEEPIAPIAPVNSTIAVPPTVAPAIVTTAAITPGTPEWAERAPGFLSQAVHVILRELPCLSRLYGELVEQRIWELGPEPRADWATYCREVFFVEPAFVHALLDLHATYAATCTGGDL